MAEQNPFAFIETPEQARQRTSFRSDISDSTSLTDFLATLIGRGVQAARGRGPQKQAVEQAEEVQSALQRAMSSAGFDAAKPGMSAVDANSAFMLNAVRELNSIGRPDLALQFAQRLGDSEADRAAIRKDLLAGDAAEAEMEEFEATSPGRIQEATSFGLQDPETGEIAGPFIVSDPKGRRRMAAEIARARAEGRTVLPVNAAQLADLSSAERLAMLRLKNSATDAGDASKRVLDRFHQQATSTLGVLGSIADMANVVNADIAAGAPNAWGERTRSFLSSLGFQLRSFARSNSGLSQDEFDTQHQKAMSTIQQSALRNAQFQSIALDLAYALARARDPGGRLSDFDVELAIKTTQASAADPTVLLSTLAMIGRRVYRTAKDAAVTVEQLPPVQAALGRIDGRLQEVVQAFGNNAVIDLSDPEALRKYLSDTFTFGEAGVSRKSATQPASTGRARVIGVRRKGE